MYHIGIDIGSTATKVTVLDENDSLVTHRLLPSGWNMKETALQVGDWLQAENYLPDGKVVATGYGRISVPFADRVVTEITCHAKGGMALAGAKDLVILDIGGQDMKVIEVKNGVVSDFRMNDKCSAGTGRFFEIMANRLGLSIAEMFSEAQKGRPITLSSTCTVFAESEITSLMSEGTPQADIAQGVLRQIITKAQSMLGRSVQAPCFLSGGFANTRALLDALSELLPMPVSSHPDARFAGSLGAALLAK